MSDLTEALDGATGESALQDNVSRIRTAAAYFLLTDGDATLHMVRYLYKFILADIDTAVGYLEQMQDILYTRITPGATVDFSQDVEDLGRLNSTRTQIGTIVLNRILAHIDEAGAAVNGVQLDSLVARMTSIRPGLDTALSRMAEGAGYLMASLGYPLDAAEVYYTTTRSRVAQGYLSSAQQLASEGRYDEAMRYMAASAAGLIIPAGVTPGVKSPVAVTPSPAGARPIEVTGTSPVFPLFNDNASLTLDLEIDGVALSLPFPPSIAAEAVTVPLPASITFAVDAYEVLDYPGGPMTAAFPAGTYTPGQVRVILAAVSPYGATLDANNAVHVVGARGPGAFFAVDEGASTADAVLQMSCYPGRDVTVHDVTELWAGTPGVTLSDTGGVATLTAENCIELDLPAGPVQALLALPVDTYIAYTDRVVGTGLTVGDVVYGDDPHVGAEVLRRYDGFWLLKEFIRVPEGGQLTVSVPAAAQHQAIVQVLSEAESVAAFAYFKNGFPDQAWNKAVYLLPLADRSEALNFVAGTISQLEQLKTTLQTYTPTPVPDVDKLFDRMTRYGLDLAAWYLATLQLDLFFNAPTSQLSSIGRIAALGRDVMSSLEG